MDAEQALGRLKHLTEEVLPERARHEHWPIRFDHCFKRICFDAAFGDVWHHHIARPAERHLQGEPLIRALRCAEQLASGDRSLLDQRNADSLRWRGKLAPSRVKSSGRRTLE